MLAFNPSTEKTEAGSSLYEFVVSLVYTGNSKDGELKDKINQGLPAHSCQMRIVKTEPNTLESMGFGLCVEVLTVFKVSFAPGAEEMDPEE